MFQTSVLASGSKGNSVLVRSQDSAILVDAGISMKRVFHALDQLKVPAKILKGIIISHEHSDHTKGAGAISRKLKIPVYISPDTHAFCAHKLGDLKGHLAYFETGTPFEVGDILVNPFSSSHDAIDSSNFVFEYEDKKLGFAIDLGYPSRLTLHKLSDANTLILESNHDHDMLMEGPYDWALKMRVKGDKGHLSNEQAVGLISQILHPGLKTIILAHLSEINNHPELAFQLMQNFLHSVRSDIRLMVASQDYHTPLIDI